MIDQKLCRIIKEVENKFCCSRDSISFHQIDKDYLIYLEFYGEYYLMSTWEKIDEPEKYLETIKKTYKVK